jgi:hypothetical protein
MPYIIVAIHLCASGWCAHAEYIVNAPSKDACMVWVKKNWSVTDNLANGTMLSCLEMPGWAVIDTADPKK